MTDKTDGLPDSLHFPNCLRATHTTAIYKAMEETVSSLKDFHDETERWLQSGGTPDLQAYMDRIVENRIPLLSFEYEDIKEDIGPGLMPEICETAVKDVRAVLARPRKQLVVGERPERIERVQRVTLHSLRHLAAHSEYWRQVGLSGVFPDRMMAQVYEDSWITYENVFFRMAVDQMNEVVRQETAKNAKRKNDRKQIREIAAFRESSLNQDHYSDWYKGQVCAELFSSLLGSETEELRHDEEAAEKERTIRTARKVIWEVQESQIYKELKKQPNLPLPIKPTNVIMMDERYHRIYKLWQHMTGEKKLELCEKTEGGTDSQGNLYYTEYIAAVMAWAIQKAQGWKRQRYRGRITSGIHELALTADVDEFRISADTVMEDSASHVLLRIAQSETLRVNVSKPYQKLIAQAAASDPEFFGFDADEQKLLIHKPVDLGTADRFLSGIQNGISLRDQELYKRIRDAVVQPAAKEYRIAVVPLLLNPPNGEAQFSEWMAERLKELRLWADQRNCDSVLCVYPMTSYDLDREEYGGSKRVGVIRHEAALQYAINYGNAFQDNCRQLGNYRAAVLPISRKEPIAPFRMLKYLQMQMVRLRLEWKTASGICPVCKKLTVGCRANGETYCQDEKCGAEWNLRRCPSCGKEHPWVSLTQKTKTRLQNRAELFDEGVTVVKRMTNQEMLLDDSLITDFRYPNRYRCPLCGW